MSTDDRLEKPGRFFKEIAYLTAHDEVISGKAVVSPAALRAALGRVDFGWYRKI